MKLNIKLILLSLASLTVGCIVFVFMFNGYVYYFFNTNKVSINLYNAGVITAFLIAILIGISLFNLIIGKKIKYLQNLSNEVVMIAQGDFGRQVKVKGNDEISTLAKNINYMSLELKERFEKEKELENTKYELITNVSHDLRTPLTSIIGYIKLIKDKQYKDEAQFNQYIEIVSNKSEKLRLMISDLFEYTKLTNEDLRLDTSPINIIQMLEQLLEEFFPIMDQQQLKVIKEILTCEAIVEADVDKLVRLYENIISNAIKYSIKPGTIKVKAFKTNDYVITAIENEAQAISEIQLNKLFDRFYKSDSSRSEAAGSGLGLAISKSIATLHKGDIWAEVNGNSIIFNIKIPLIDNTRGRFFCVVGL